MKTKRQKLESKLDKIWRTVGKEHAHCEICATLDPQDRVNYTQLHPHHIVGRQNKLLRWDIKNRIWLCSSHHVFGKDSVHNNPLWFTEWLKENRPKIYKYLQEKRKIPYKQWTIEELEEKLDLLKNI